MGMLDGKVAIVIGAAIVVDAALTCFSPIPGTPRFGVDG